MAYVDKCCGVCDEYVGIRDDYKRFALCNVGECCITSKSLQGVPTEDLTLHPTAKSNLSWPLNRRVRELRGGGYGKRVGNTKWYKPIPISKVRFPNPHTEYYEITHEKLKGVSYFTNGGIFSRDKRKLRRVLRKLGVSGKVEELIK